MKSAFRSFSRLSLLALALALVASPAVGSEVDSWGGQIWLRHETDVFALPHRALDFTNSATLIYTPSSSEPGDFRGTPSDDAAGGVLMFGKDSWQGIIGANVPIFFNPLQAHGLGTARGWGYGLTAGDPNEWHLVHGIDGSDFIMPTGRLHLGLALQATDALGVGASFQRFGSESTDETTVGTNPAQKDGYDVSGYNLGLSAGWELGGVLNELEAAVSFGSGDKEQFQPDPMVAAGGKGDASTFSIAGIATFDDQGWISSKYDLDYNAYFRYDNTSSDFTDNLAEGATTAAPKEEADFSMVDARIGIAYQNGGFKMGTSFGIKDYTDEVKSTGSSGARLEEKYEVTYFPCCDFAGDIPVWKGLGFQYGMMVAWESQTLTDTNFDDTGTQTNKDEMEHKEVMSAYTAGLLWDITEDWRITATLNTNELSNPGGVVTGNGVSDPLIALGARVNF
jgi:hypothetical protein